MTQQEKSISIHTICFKELLGNTEYTFRIPPYQRAYVWTKEKISELLEDWKEFINSEQCNAGIPYYMGTLILHKEIGERKINIIDGQQRLTTLLIVDYVWNQGSSILEKFGNIAFNVHSSLSKKNIEQVKAFVKEKPAIDILDKIKFSVVETTSEDDAFIFFDSQNNRGVRPSAINVLKAIHLRGIINNEPEQERCALDWDNLDKGAIPVFKDSGKDFLDDMIDLCLWRSRNWRGNQFDFADGKYNMLMHEFSKKTKKSDANQLTYYSYGTKRSFTVNSSGKNESIDEKKESLAGKEKENLFSIRQPLFKGISFFRYVSHYSEIAAQLFNLTQDPNADYQRLYKRLYIDTNASVYMKHLFIVSLVFYYDKFGKQGLYQFALWVDLFIGDSRISKYYVKKETLRNKLQNHNFLDIIHLAYEPEEVIDYMKSIPAEPLGKELNNPTKKYIKASQSYFQTNENIIEKRNWIEKHAYAI